MLIQIDILLQKKYLGVIESNTYYQQRIKTSKIIIRENYFNVIYIYKYIYSQKTDFNT